MIVQHINNILYNYPRVCNKYQNEWMNEQMDVCKHAFNAKATTATATKTTIMNITDRQQASIPPFRSVYSNILINISLV